MKKTILTTMLLVVGLTTFAQKSIDVSSKCDGCVMKYINYFPDTVKTINQNILTNGCLYIKKRLWGNI